MAKKTLRELVLDAVNLADGLHDLDGGVEEPVRDIFKPNDTVTAVQLRQMAYKLRVQSAMLSGYADFIEENAKKVEAYRPAYWRFYTGFYLDAVEDQMDKSFYCLRKMEEDANKLKAENEPYDSEPVYVHGPDDARSMITELTEIGQDIEANFREKSER